MDLQTHEIAYNYVKQFVLSSWNFPKILRFVIVHLQTFFLCLHQKKSTIKQRGQFELHSSYVVNKIWPIPFTEVEIRSCYMKSIRPKWPMTWGLWSLKWRTTRVKSCTLCRLVEGWFFYDRHLSVKLNWFTVKTRPMTEKHMMLRVLHKPTSNSLLTVKTWLFEEQSVYTFKVWHRETFNTLFNLW